MLMYQDPSMKDIVVDFCNECKKQIPQLNDCLYNLEDDITSKKDFEVFGQVIDRMMGAAKSLEINMLGNFCELGKTIGYKASQVDDENLLSIVVAILFDAVEILDNLVKKLENSEPLEIKEISTDAFVSRLRWLSDKFKHIKRGSVAFNEKVEEEKKDANSLSNIQGDIDDLLKQLGL